MGVAPVPILLSVIFKPDGVVMVVPTACAVALPENPATRARATRALAHGKTRILLLLWIDRVRASRLFISTVHALPLLFLRLDQSLHGLEKRSPGEARSRNHLQGGHSQCV